MAYRTRSARRLSRSSKRIFFATIIICALLIYATITWILPSFINSVGFIKGNLNPHTQTSPAIETTLAPPVLNIPYEATNSATIDIKGFATSHSKVKIFVDEVETEVEADESGSFIAKEIVLSLGTNNIYGKTLDEKNHESLPSKTIRLIYDNEKPILEVNSPQDGQSFSGERKIAVSGKTEPGTIVTVNDRRIIVENDGTFQTQFPLNDGENNLTIKSSDAASNAVEIQRKVTFQP